MHACELYFSSNSQAQPTKNLSTLQIYIIYITGVHHIHLYIIYITGIHHKHYRYTSYTFQVYIIYITGIHHIHYRYTSYTVEVYIMYITVYIKYITVYIMYITGIRHIFTLLPERIQNDKSKYQIVMVYY